MFATSYPVHPHKPMSINSIGLLPVFLSPSTTIPWALLDSPTKRWWSVQVAVASSSFPPAPLPPIVRTRFWMDQHTEQLRRILLEADLQIGLDIVHARQWQFSDSVQ